MTLTKIGASLGGGADTIFVTQAGHGLTLGYPVKANGNGTYAHATANTAANAEAIGIIIETTTDTMLIALSGRVTVDGCVPNLSAGTVLFLQVSAGLLAAAEPSGNTQVSKPMAVITYANSEMILLSHRGEVISTAGVVSAPIDVNYLVGTANSTLSAEIVVGTAPGGELGNTWASPTVDGTHSGSAHHADAHTVASHSDTTATGTELNLLDGGTSVGSSITVLDADGFIVNDGGSMKTVPASDIKTYIGAVSSSAAPDADDDASQGYSVGLVWADTTADLAYVCLDSSNGAAVWLEITKQGGNALATTLTSRTTFLNSGTRIYAITPSTSSKKIRIIGCSYSYNGGVQVFLEVWFGTGAGIGTTAGKEIFEPGRAIPSSNAGQVNATASITFPSNEGPVGAVNEKVSVKMAASANSQTVILIYYKEE